MIAKIILPVDTDAVIHGLGEIGDFAGVDKGMANLREYFTGRDPMQVVRLVPECWGLDLCLAVLCRNRNVPC